MHDCKRDLTTIHLIEVDITDLPSTVSLLATTNSFPKLTEAPHASYATALLPFSYAILALFDFTLPSRRDPLSQSVLNSLFLDCLLLGDNCWRHMH